MDFNTCHTLLDFIQSTRYIRFELDVVPDGTGSKLSEELSNVSNCSLNGEELHYKHTQQNYNEYLKHVVVLSFDAWPNESVEKPHSGVFRVRLESI